MVLVPAIQISDLYYWLKKNKSVSVLLVEEINHWMGYLQTNVVVLSLDSYI